MSETSTVPQPEPADDSDALELPLEQIETVSGETLSLKPFDLLQNPVWIYDVQRLRVLWANQAALPLWNATSRQELQKRSYSGISEATRIHLQNYLRQFEQGKVLTEQWTFYPEGRPVAVQCRCSGIAIGPGQLAMLVEGKLATAQPVSPDHLRALEALRHTSAMLSLYTLDGLLLQQNRAAQACYGGFEPRGLTSDPTASENSFLSQFADPTVGQQAMATLQAGAAISLDAQVLTLAGTRWHHLDGHCINDPIDGKPMMLISEYDITRQQTTLRDRRDAEAELEEQRAFLRQIIDVLPSLIYVRDLHGCFVALNQRAADIHGISVEAMLGRRDDDFNANISREELQRFLTDNQTVMDSRQTLQKVECFPTATGKLDWYQTILCPWIDTQGNVKGIIGTSANITELKQAEAELRYQAERVRMISDSTQNIRKFLNLDCILNTTVAEVQQFLGCDRVMIYRFDPNGTGVVVAEALLPGWRSLLHSTLVDPGLTQPPETLFPTDSIFASVDIYTAGLSQGHLALLDQWQVRAELVMPICTNDQVWGLLMAHQCCGTRQWQQLEIDLLRQLVNQVALTIQQSDMVDRLETANSQLEQLATLDGLTQVPNRRSFDEYLEQEWHHALREQCSLSLILCDVDFFKAYNDTYGHQAGDRCLQQVATLIKQHLKRSTDMVARYGGEEFALILPHTPQQGASFLFRDIQTSLHQLAIPHQRSQVADWVTISAGIASIIPQIPDQSSTLVKRANQALYQAKAVGRDRAIISETPR
jgi:diguanylate cyclase (GGDEF)-like protein/PAS domain S-box-containing protein